MTMLNHLKNLFSVFLPFERLYTKNITPQPPSTIQIINAPNGRNGYTNNGSNKTKAIKPASYVYSAVIEKSSFPFLLSTITIDIGSRMRNCSSLFLAAAAS